MTIITHDDPMSFHAGREEISHRECSGDRCMSVRFESEENKKAYLDIPVEESTFAPDNPLGEGVDEG